MPYVLVVVASVLAAHFSTQDSADYACTQASHSVTEINRRTPQLAALGSSMRAFVLETKRARSNKSGSSYDPHFVRVIDENVLPALNTVNPQPLAQPHC